MPISLAELPANVVEALQRGNAREAIKLLRQSTGLGLKDATYVVADLLRGRKPPAVQAASSGGVGAVHARDPPKRRPGLSPGEVPRSGGGLWWVVALAVGVLVSWYLLQVPS